MPAVVNRAVIMACALTASHVLQVEALLDTIKWDSNGLVVAIAQHIDTGAILMQGFANRDAVATTMNSHLATFYSRSRANLWTKGETSSNFINVLDVFFDCDHDSIIYLGVPDGPTCHTGAETCYFTSAADILGSLQSGTKSALTTLYLLEDIIKQKKLEIEEQTTTSSNKASWTKTLLENRKLLCSKIREEADELCRSVEEDEGKDRTSSEFADVLYHAMVLLAVQDVNLQEVMKILRARFSQSGIDEKKNRKSGL
ncbi:hypothetical protein O6H91_22G050600 [Diphasiastrum complanatum]|uniref:Uncharacterized protein n=2 Tax=Diphasiastrum complanatum TaxID=34168 RepID=A0ACC2AH53_DIPCM|nr:hypothetical protein O6H91_22G050000 [Diphasiastrum complanatum]KAJ7516264.1 hypothetical protein O6H91_22G050600 [Diphasiastrum complanatum]